MYVIMYEVNASWDRNKASLSLYVFLLDHAHHSYLVKSNQYNPYS